MKIKEFPAEFFIKLDGQDFLLGRLSVNKMNQSFWVEIDIVQKESKKMIQIQPIFRAAGVHG